MNLLKIQKMTVRNIRFVLVAALFIMLAAGFTFGQAGKPEQTAKTFYKWYLHELNAEKDPVRDNKTKMRQYISTRLAKWVASKAYREYDADYFIDAQDFGHDWEKNITVSNVVVNRNTATLRVTLEQPANADSTAWNRVLDLKLLKEAGVWKIDRIKGKE